MQSTCKKREGSDKVLDDPVQLPQFGSSHLTHCNKIIPARFERHSCLSRTSIPFILLDGNLSHPVRRRGGRPMGRLSRKCKRSAFCGRELQTSDPVGFAILGWLLGWAALSFLFHMHDILGTVPQSAPFSTTIQICYPVGSGLCGRLRYMFVQIPCCTLVAGWLLLSTCRCWFAQLLHDKTEVSADLSVGNCYAFRFLGSAIATPSLLPTDLTYLGEAGMYGICRIGCFYFQSNPIPRLIVVPWFQVQKVGVHINEKQARERQDTSPNDERTDNNNKVFSHPPFQPRESNPNTDLSCRYITHPVQMRA